MLNISKTCNKNINLNLALLVKSIILSVSGGLKLFLYIILNSIILSVSGVLKLFNCILFRDYRKQMNYSPD